MKQTENSTIALLLGFFLLLPLVGCEKDEPQYSIVGQWEECRGCGVVCIFPENGVLEYFDNEHYSRTVKYRMTENNDSIQYIIIHQFYTPNISAMYDVHVFNRKIYFYNNDSIKIERNIYYDSGWRAIERDMMLVRIKE